MDQRHRRLDGVQVHSAKGDVSGQRAMEEEDTGMVSCCRKTLGGGRPTRERESRVRNYQVLYSNYQYQAHIVQNGMR